MCTSGVHLCQSYRCGSGAVWRAHLMWESGGNSAPRAVAFLIFSVADGRLVSECADRLQRNLTLFIVPVARLSLISIVIDCLTLFIFCMSNYTAWLQTNKFISFVLKKWNYKVNIVFFRNTKVIYLKIYYHRFSNITWRSGVELLV